MKKNYYSLLCCLYLAGTTSCNDENVISSENMVANMISVIANTPGNGTNSRLAFNDDASNRLLSVDWKESGESFSVIRGSENQTYTQTSSTTDDKNVFEGISHTTETGTYYAFYPSDTEVTNVTAIPYDLSLQNGILDQKKTYMYASTETLTDDTELDFRQLTAILKPTFAGLGSGETVKNITLTLPETVYAQGTFDLINGTSTSTTENIQEINVSYNGNDNVIYIYSPAMESGAELKFMVTTEANIYTGTLTANKEIKTGVLYTATISLSEVEASDNVWTSATVASTSVEGDGTEENPYLVQSAADLQWLVENAASSEGQHYKLMQNLVINSSASTPWNPIGNSNQFKGTFDGNEHFISGSLVSAYTVNAYGASIDFGFFGSLGETATVKNLHLNFDVTGGKTKNDKRSAEHSNTGVLAGANYGLIENCIITGNVQGGNAPDDVNISHTGGIVGQNHKTIKNCINYANVKGGYGANYSCTGGFAGRLGDNYNKSGTIEECVNYGNIQGGSSSGTVATGGIVGYIHWGTIKTNCNNGNITGTGTIGGVVGKNDYGTICTCNQDNSDNGLSAVGSGSQSQIDECTGTHQ